MISTFHHFYFSSFCPSKLDCNNFNFLYAFNKENMIRTGDLDLQSDVEDKNYASEQMALFSKYDDDRHGSSGPK